MPIIYSLIAYHHDIIVDYTLPNIYGNFHTVSSALINKINFSPNNSNKLSYTYDSYMFHYIIHCNYIYLCITDQKYDRTIAFKYLRSVRNEFEMKFNVNEQSTGSNDNNIAASTVTPIASISKQQYKKFADTLESHMFTCNDEYESTHDNNQHTPSNSTIELNDIRIDINNKQQQSTTYQPEPGSKLYDIRHNIDSMQPVLINSIDQLMSRGEKLELLVDKASELEHGAIKFNRSSTTMKNQYFYDNVKQYGVLIGCGTLFVVLMYALFS